MGQRWNYFADKEINYPTWAFNCMIRFLKFQKERVEKEEIQEPLRNFMNICIFFVFQNEPFASGLIFG